MSAHDQNRYKTLVLRASFALVLLGFFLYFIDWENFNTYLSWQTVWGALAAQIAILIAVFLMAVRHSFLVSRPAAPLKPTAIAVFLAQGLIFIIPGRLPEFLKATYLRKTCDVPLSAGVTAIFFERLMDLVVIGLLAAVALPLAGLTGFWLFIPVFFLGGPLTFVLFAHWKKHWIEWLLGRLPHEKLRDFAKTSLHYFTVKLTLRDYSFAFFVGIMIWGCFLLSYVILFYFWQAPSLSFGAIVAVYIAGILGATIPLLPGGLGSVEGAAAFALLQFGYNFTQAVEVTIGMRFSQILFLLPFSLILLVFVRTGVSTILRDFKGKSDNRTNVHSR